MNGVVMVSPYLSSRGGDSAPDFSPMPWVSTLPSMAASNYERQGKTLSAELMSRGRATTPAASSSPT